MKRIRSLETIKGIPGLILVDIFQYCFFVLLKRRSMNYFFKRKLSSLEIVPVVILEVDCDSLVFS